MKILFRSASERKSHMTFRLTAIGLAAICCWGACFLLGFGQPDAPPAPEPQPATPRFPVRIRTPAGPPRVKTAQLDANGRPAEVRCNTCHATRVPNLSARSADDFKDFHQGLKFQHGKLTCLSCHHADDYESLRHADGRKIGFPQVMDLCSQCHGPQARDYAHGAHGGMTGYWDLSRGPRDRNNCIDCHDSHAPAFPKARPVFAPKDRFPPHREKDVHP
jgi:hypothetical protein